MESNLIFSNNGILSLLDLTTMGDSSKRDDNSKTGKYDSGLKYAIAILLRNNIDILIKSGDYEYTFIPELVIDKVTKKEKHLITIKQFSIDYGTSEYHTTGFAVNLGYDWEFWMAIREIYSNCLDENGKYSVTSSDWKTHLSFGLIEDTHIFIKGDNQLQEIIDNWNAYFLIEQPLYTSNQEHIKIYENNLPNKEYTIYKNGIKIYSDPEQQSKYVYDHAVAEIDEMRVIRDVYSTETEISYALKRMNVDEVIKDYINTYDSNNKESQFSGGNFSQNWVDIINDLYSNGSLPELSSNLMNSIMNDNRFSIGKKKIEYASHNWTPKVDVEIIKSELREVITTNPNTMIDEISELTFEEHIIKMCEKFNIKIEFPIIESVVSSNIFVIGSDSEKTLYIDSKFNEENMWEIIKEQYKLKSNDKNLIYKDFASDISDAVTTLGVKGIPTKI